MGNYFIEVRVLGSMKYDLRSLIYDVRKKCRLGRGSRPIPHISLVYNPSPVVGRQEETRLITDFIKVCSKYELIQIKFDGWGSFEAQSNNGVAFVNIEIPQRMRDLRWDLVCRLKYYCNLDKEYDLKIGNFHPHATVAMKLSPLQLDRVNNYLKTQRPPKKHYYFARATLLKSGKILCEYDFALRRSLTRAEALDKRVMRQTFSVIGEQIADRNSNRNGTQYRNPRQVLMSRFKLRRVILIILGFVNLLLAGFSLTSQGILGLSPVSISLVFIGLSIGSFIAARGETRHR